MVPPGTPIAVIAPASAYDPAKLGTGLAIARERGHDLRVLPGLLQPHRYLASPDDQRLAHLVHALSCLDYGAVWIVRGGYGVTRLLPRIPWAELAPRPIIGFSDLTAFFVPWHAMGGTAIHGPVLHSLGQTDPASTDHLFDLLAGAPVPPLRGAMWRGGTATGWLCGGNLCVLAASCGTPWQLDATGAILVLEEVGEAPYRVDRLLQQLVSAGVLDGVRGVAVGDLTTCRPPAGAGWNVREIFEEHLGPLGVPILGDLPIGHGPENRAFVWGDRALLSNGQLTIEGRGDVGPTA